MSVSLLKIAADLQLSLAAAVTVGQTTATLASASDADGVALPSGKYGFTVDGDTSAKEYIVCDLVGTALTNIQNVSRQDAATTGFANYHRFGATVTITDWAILSRMLNNLNGTTGFDAASPLSYDGDVSGLVGNDIPTVNYVLSVVNGGTVSFDQQVLTSQTAGENLTAEDSVYQKASDGAWYKTDADTQATVQDVVQGIALATQTTGGTLQIAISGAVQMTSTVIGTRYYVSSTAGAFVTSAPSAPAFARLVGIGLPSNKLLLCPPSTLAQFSGIAAQPSATNKFLAQADSSDDGTDQSQTTQNATSAVGQADTSGLRVKLAQSFVPTKTTLRGVALYKAANTGTFTGTVTVSIQADTAGSPSGSALSTKTITNALWAAYSVAEFTALFSAEITLTLGSTYWIVVETSTTDTANCINLGTNSAGGYGSGSVKYNNTTDGWVAVSTIDLYFKTLQGVVGKAILADSSGFLPVGTRKASAKVGNLILANSATANVVAHGLGRIPNFVEATCGGGSSGHGSYSAGIYDVANNAYACNGFTYNEGSAGGQESGTSQVVVTQNGTGTGAVSITVSVDENVVIFSADANTRTITYKIF